MPLTSSTYAALIYPIICSVTSVIYFTKIWIYSGSKCLITYTIANFLLKSFADVGDEEGANDGAFEGVIVGASEGVIVGVLLGASVG